MTNNLSYQKIAKWEVLHKEHDFAYHTTNLFYKAVRIILKQVFNSISVRIRKGQLKGRNLMAKDVRKKPNLDRILKSDIGYRDLKAIRTSPDYLENIRKKLYAMIRQVGPPTFFISLSSAENHWDPLVSTLKAIRKRRNRIIENEIQSNEIDSLIRNDPVTCARYYRNKMCALRNCILHDSKYYGDIQDFFFVTEFQNRGSEHDHTLLWV